MHTPDCKRKEGEGVKVSEDLGLCLCMDREREGGRIIVCPSMRGLGLRLESVGHWD